jgi:hypothetical protein
MTMTLSGRRFSTGVSRSLNGVVDLPCVVPLVWMPGVLVGKLGIADMVKTDNDTLLDFLAILILIEMYPIPWRLCHYYTYTWVSYNED